MDNQKINRGGQRDSNLELYRIIVMIMIVAHHFVVNSGVMERMYEAPLSANSIFLFIFGAWGKTGINCFVLITGYFMCKSNITVKKYIKLVAEVYLYKLIIAAIFAIAGLESMKDIIDSLLIVRVIDTNFTGCFLVFYLLIPFLNVMLKNMNKTQHIKLIAVLAFMYVFCGTIPKFYVTFNYVSWFVFIYFIAAYLRFYVAKQYKWGFLTVFFILLAVTSILVCLFIGEGFNKQAAYMFVSDSNTFLALAISICSFMYFKNLKIGYSKLINTIGGSTFGVLLIHANSDTMREWLWKRFLNVSNAFDFVFVKLVLFSVVSVAGVFISCIVIDVLRKELLEKSFMGWIEKTRFYIKLMEKFL